MTDHRLYAPAVARNREPILDVLRAVLPAHGTVLEIASGTGEHVVHFARHLPHLTFQPSDPDQDALHSIAAWSAESVCGNILPPVLLDAAAPPWPVAAAQAIICINMIHISPWAATVGLMRGAAALLPAGAPLYLYGPYRQGGAHTAPSNQAFDDSLRARDPRWGVRDLGDVAGLAADAGFGAPTVIQMPANNLSMFFVRDIARAG
ncbi:DUF938 domain-containing protein [Oleomonas cavernae]|uniref:DUF938 domain-containing protein n=1 Tax=Oleomonas cavernae TaxID=2320859 RepID=A0A418WD01_9PROT|nr:DUF938 domain-containing protein [Oleomonas cavernae]RJF87828.1 DUF938 domain-containing protein [Oleomonas cavernae]